jgi:acetyl esterase/lipase
MALTKQIAHAWRGARREVALQQGAVAKLVRALLLLKLVVRELLGTLLLAPYGLRAALCRRALVGAGRLRVERYGLQPRNSVEVVVGAAGASTLKPVVVFVNGGVWSAGDAWQFAPLAQALSDSGAVVCVAQYTLYPATTAPTMVLEVQAAVEWVQRNVARFGGDAARVSVVGHSAGAHLAASAVLSRARAPPPLPPLHAFVGIAGVYDVAEHFRFETWRGVQNLSTMEAAMGGQEAFAALSPSLTLHAALAPHLPPFVLLSSEADSTVPTGQSDTMLRAAMAAGASATHLVYSSITHLQFATGWEYGRPVVDELPLLGEPHSRRVMAHVADVIAVVSRPSRSQLAVLIKDVKTGTLKQPALPRRPAAPRARAQTAALPRAVA